MRAITGSHAVIGAGFGDEGKGHVVDWLCDNATDYPVVFRFSGGPQAAHHVVLPKTEEVEHVFSHFGSGSLRGALTNWTHYCPVNPVSLINELDDLKLKCPKPPRLRIDPRCPVITPYDLAWNAHWEDVSKHGTCGAGIFATLRREGLGYLLHFEDIYHPTALRMKLDLIRQFYDDDPIGRVDTDAFLTSCQYVVEERVESVDIGLFHPDPPSVTIYEGSQGLLLDEEIGFFPHVTPSSTGLKNILELRNGSAPSEIWLVTRAYQTRHGAGPMTHEFSDSTTFVNPYERSYDDGPQGRFRRGYLDLDLLEYATSKAVGTRRVNLVVNCMDLLLEAGKFRAVIGGRIHAFPNVEQFMRRIIDTVDASEAYVSYGPTSDDIVQWTQS